MNTGTPNNEIFTSEVTGTPSPKEERPNQTNFMQTGTGHCYICHQDYELTDNHYFNIGCVQGKPTPCTEKCRKWFRPNQTNTLEEIRKEWDNFCKDNMDTRRYYADFWISKITSSNNSLIERIREFVGEDMEYEPLDIICDDAVVERGKRRLNEDRKIINEERARIRNFLSTLNEKE